MIFKMEKIFSFGSHVTLYYYVKLWIIIVDDFFKLKAFQVFKKMIFLKTLVILLYRWF
jgi:hypothetical protein